jgi:hypothetical protein
MHIRIATLAALALLAVVPARAATTTIKAILDAPASFADQSVTVVGTVDALTLGFKGETFYEIRDAGLPIAVVGYGTALAPGTQVQVTGTVRVRPPDEEFTFPPVIQESAHQVQ